MLIDQKTIDDKFTEINKFLTDNVDFVNYTEEQKDAMFAQLTTDWLALKDIIKNAECKFDLMGIEIDTLYKKLHQNVEYTAETIFYGLNIKKKFINTLPTKTSLWTLSKININFSMSVMLYHVISTLTVKGLNRESYAFANILYKLAEITKVYNHYDNQSAILSKSMKEWNMGLSADDINAFKTNIAEVTAQEIIDNEKITG